MRASRDEYESADDLMPREQRNTHERPRADREQLVDVLEPERVGKRVDIGDLREDHGVRAPQDHLDRLRVVTVGVCFPRTVWPRAREGRDRVVRFFELDRTP